MKAGSRIGQREVDGSRIDTLPSSSLESVKVHDEILAEPNASLYACF